MTQWTEEDPGAGDLGSVADAIGHLEKVGTELTELAATADSCVTGVSAAVWSGAAGNAWRTSVSESRKELTTVQQGVTAAKSALTTHQTTVADIASRAVYARHHLVEAEHEFAVVNDLLTNYQGTTMEAMVSGHIETAYSQRRDQVEAAKQALRNLAEERERADRAAQRALNDACGRSWATTRSALRAMGITGVSQLTPAILTDRFAQLVKDIAHSKADARDLRALRGFLVQFGDDQQMMNRFVQRVGGQDYTTAIDRIGKDAQIHTDGAAAGLALALALRHALSLASHGWSSATAAKFASSMMNGAKIDDGGRIAAAGFLFADTGHDVMGRTLAIAMANLIDEKERGPGAQGSWIDKSLRPGGTTLAILADKARGVDGRRVNDLPGRVFQTLGEYPDDALDWLSDKGKDYPNGGNTRGQGRITYWFGEREWGAMTTGDGWEGPASLWAGAEKAIGGPLDVKHYDPATWTKLADTTTRIVNSMGGNPHFSLGISPDPSVCPVSEIAKVRLAGALAADMPQFTEYPISGDRGGDEYADGAQFPGADGLRDLPNPEQDKLAKVTGITMTSHDGNAIVRAAIIRSQESLIQLAARGTPDYDSSRALNSVAALQGFMDGSPDGAKEAQASARDTSVKELAGIITKGAQAIPIAGTGVTAADWFATAATTGSKGIDGAIVASYHWADDYEKALDAHAKSLDAHKEALRVTLHEYQTRLKQPDRTDEWVRRYGDAYEAYTKQS